VKKPRTRQNHTFITWKAQSPNMMVIGLHTFKRRTIHHMQGILASYLTFLSFKQAEMAPKYFPERRVLAR